MLSCKIILIQQQLHFNDDNVTTYGKLRGHVHVYMNSDMYKSKFIAYIHVTC